MLHHAVMVVHNTYQQRGGEDSVVDAECDLLESRGHRVLRVGRDNAEVREMSRLKLAASTLWSTSTVRDFTRSVSRFRPDVIHAHNTFPLVSPSLYWAAARAAVPVVQTLHNYRLLCPQAMFLRQDKVCEQCLGRVPLPAVVHGCYRGSRVQSGVVASMLVLHRLLGTYTRKVSRFIALNEFSRTKFVQGGLPPHRVVVKPNYVDLAEMPLRDRRGFLYVGRLSQEKGVAVLSAAHKSQAGTDLRVVGSGPAAGLLQGLAGVSMLGPLAQRDVYDEMASARALVLPSICYENFPRTLVEAFACGLPVIASRIGVLENLVEDGKTGLLFRAGDAADLARKMQWARANAQELCVMGRNARIKYECEFTADRNYAQLISIYDAAIREYREAA